jgi:predicted acetyltransferase
MPIEIRTPAREELRGLLETTAKAFSEEARPDELERDTNVLERERTFAAYDGDLIVGTAADFGLTLTVPGGELPAAGVTMVGVLPTHRRRGILTQLMRVELDAMVERGDPLAILWSSESGIYGRYGYGIATVGAAIEADRDRIRFRGDPPAAGEVRIVGEEEAAAVLPPLYERIRRETPGMIARSEAWWQNYRLPDPEHYRHGAGPRFFAVLRLDGVDEGFARYRVKGDWNDGLPQSTLRVAEALATSPLATRELWRFLFGVDLVTKVESWTLSADHPLFLLVTEPRRLRMRLGDALWLRILDVERALAGRSYATEGTVSFELVDGFRPENAGVWHLEATEGAAQVTRPGGSTATDLRLDVADLGSVYLGAFSFAQLEQAGRVEELEPGALDRADALFRMSTAPWCPEIF